MKIRITFEVDQEMRRAMAEYYGKEGPADDKTCQGLIEGLAQCDLDIIPSDYEQNKRRQGESDA